MIRARRFLALAAGISLSAARAASAELVCDADPPVDPCAAQVPRENGGVSYNVPGQPGFDASAPWVIGGTTTVTIDASGVYTPGVSSSFGLPTIFVVEGGVLRIAGTATSKPEVAIGAVIMLCDQGAFEVQDATFRSQAAYAFQYPIFAFGQSRVTYTNSFFATLAPGAPGSGALYQLMMQHSSASLSNVTFGGTDVLELQALHHSTVSLDGVMAVSELYVGGDANLTIANSLLFDVFFLACPAGGTYDFSDLPPLCDLTITDPSSPRYCGRTDPDTKQSVWAIANYSKDGPAGSPFHLAITNSIPYSWAVTSVAGASVNASNVPAEASFSIGLSLTTDADMLVAPGAPPEIAGLEDRAFSFTDTTLRFWHVWPSAGAHIGLQPGSSVGDILPTGAGTAVTGSEVTLQGGHVTAESNTEIDLSDCTIDEAVGSVGGTLRLTRCSFVDSPLLTVGGPVYLADTAPPAGGPSFLGQGVLHEVVLTVPQDGAVIPPALVEVRGMVVATDASGPVTPLPPAHVRVTSNGAPVLPDIPLSEAVTNGLLATIDARTAPPGLYEISVGFDEPPSALVTGAAAESKRTIRITYCRPIPCWYGGVCSDTATGFSCACRDGYEGERCEIEIGTEVDDCAGQPCENGGTCTDRAAGFSCACPPGFEGDRCEREATTGELATHSKGCAAIEIPSLAALLPPLTWFMRARRRGRASQSSLH